MRIILFKKRLSILLFCLVTTIAISHSYANSTSDVEKLFPKEIKDKNVRALLNKAYEYANSDLELSIKICEKAEAISTEMKSPKRLFAVYRELGYIFEINNQLDLAIETYQKANTSILNLGFNSHQLNIYNDLAIAHRKVGKYAMSKQFHTQGLELAQTINDLEMIEYNYHGLGYLYETIGDFEQAVSYYLKSLVAAENQKSNSGIIITLQNISNTFLKLGKKEEALEYIYRAMELATVENDSFRIAKVLLDQSKVLNQIGSYDLALEKLETAYLKFKELDNKQEMVEALLQIAIIHLQKDNLDKSHQAFLKCLELKEFFSNNNFAELYFNLGNLFQLKKQSGQAKENYLKSLKYSKENSYTDLEKKNNHALYSLYSKDKDFEKAILYLENSMDLGNQLFNEKSNKNIAELELKYDTEKNEKKIQKLKLQQSKLLLYSGLVFFVLLVCTMIYIILAKAKSNNLLTKKNQEIEAQNLRLKESNEILSQYTFASAHDLKEPLRNIGGFISLLKRRNKDILNDEALEYIEFVQNGTNKMNNLLTDLLGFATISSQQPSIQEVSFQDVLKQIIYKYENEINEKEAVIEYPQEQLVVHIQESHLSLLLENLLSNALKFVTKKPFIQINTTSSTQVLLIELKDNGIGLSEEYKEKVFNLFYRLDKQKGYDGNGVGLTICKNIVRKYNGEIWFESLENKGTSFFISLPIKNYLASTTEKKKTLLEKEASLQ